MKNSLSVLFYIKKNQPKKNGLCSVLVRITTENENVCFSSNIDVDPRTWSSKLGRVQGRTQDAITHNRYIEDLRYSIVTKHTILLQKGDLVTAKQVRDALLNIEEKDPNTIISIFSKHNDDMSRLIGREVVKSTHTRYVKTLSRLKQFLLEVKNVDDMPMKDVTPMFIRDFEIYLKTIGKCTDNLTAKSLKQFKKIVGIAIDNSLISGNPFANIKLHFTYEERSYLTQTEVDKMIQKKFSVKRLEQVRDMFIFSCYTNL